MESNLELATGYLRRIADLDFAGALALASDGAEFRGPDGAVLDLAAMRSVLDMVRPRFAGPLALAIGATTCEGNRVCIEATGAAPLTNGKTYSNRYHYAFEIVEGRIASCREYCCTKSAAVIFED